MGACGSVWENVAGIVAGCGACGRGWGYVVQGQAYDMDGDMWQGWGHVVGCGVCGRVWGHVAGLGGMWQGWWQDVGACGRVGVCGRGSGL